MHLLVHLSHLAAAWKWVTTTSLYFNFLGPGIGHPNLNFWGYPVTHSGCATGRRLFDGNHNIFPSEIVSLRK